MGAHREAFVIAKGQTYTGITICLDGGTYTDCRFERCTIIISGVLPITLENPRFVDCQWSFIGPASTTVSFMQAMYRAGAKELIEATCNNIMGKGPRPSALGAQ
jgi:hypothetical protein